MLVCYGGEATRTTKKDAPWLAVQLPKGSLSMDAQFSDETLYLSFTLISLSTVILVL
jgi:hypothetical protein